MFIDFDCTSMKLNFLVHSTRLACLVCSVSFGLAHSPRSFHVHMVLDLKLQDCYFHVE